MKNCRLDLKMNIHQLSKQKQSLETQKKGILIFVFKQRFIKFNASLEGEKEETGRHHRTKKKLVRILTIHDLLASYYL